MFIFSTFLSQPVLNNSRYLLAEGFYFPQIILLSLWLINYLQHISRFIICWISFYLLSIYFFLNVTHTNIYTTKKEQKAQYFTYEYIYNKLLTKLIDWFIYFITIEFLVCLQYSRCQEYSCEQETQISTLVPFILVGE